MKKETKVTAEPGKQELFITREFDAPREMVFKAFTDPDLLVQWLGPCDMTMKIDKFDSGTGGYWRFIHVAKNGQEFAFHGVTHEYLKPSRLIRTFEFEGLPETGHVVLETAKFSELDGDRTRLVIQSVFQTVEDRDGMVMSGMEKGVSEGHEMLDKLFEKLLAKSTTL